MNAVVEWLESPPGWRWAEGHFSMEATDCHAMIELRDDNEDDEIAEHTEISAAITFRYLIRGVPEWRGVTWTPDQPPERV